MKGGLKQLTPAPIWRPASRMYWWWYNRGQHKAAAFLDPQWRRSKKRLTELAGIHRGQRCFVIGNGPSLSKMDLSPLRDEITLGMNRIYLAFDETGFSTTYYVAVNTLVIEQCAGEIRKLTMPKFVTWRGRRWLAGDPRIIYLDTDYTGPETFAKDLTGRVFEGGTVTFVALQLALYLGFQEVILIGVDHDYVTKGQPNLTVTSDGEDLNHFHPGYFGRGYRWQLPDLEASERAYRLAKQEFESARRAVLDATIGGKLNVFPKIDYTSLFQS